MKSNRIFTCVATLVGALGISAPAVSGPLEPGMENAGLASAFKPSLDVPLRDWVVDPNAFIAKLKAGRQKLDKAATDLATVYRPIPVCRLFDTRGFAAAIVVAGPFAPNSTTNIASAGNCGIPASIQVAGLSLSFTVQNLTPNSGGYISFLEQGAPLTGINTVFNPGAEWVATTANVSIPGGGGNFSIVVANAQVHVIVDVNGYYQNLNELDVGTQELDINGTSLGTTLGVNNSGGGTAIAAVTSGGTGTGTAVFASASGGTGLSVGFNSAVRASGAGVDTNTWVFRHQVNTANFPTGTICSGFPAYTVLDHPMLNNDPNAMVFVTPRTVSGSVVSSSLGPFEAYYISGTSCGGILINKWTIRDRPNAPHINNSQFNVMVIKP